MYHRRVNFMHNVLLIVVRLGLEAAGWKGSVKCMLLYDEESLKKFQQRSPFFSQGAVYRPAMLIKMNLFTGIFQCFLQDIFHSCSQIFKTVIYRTSDGCFPVLFLINYRKFCNFATWQDMVFIYVKHSIDRFKFIYTLLSITKFNEFMQ